MKKFVHVLFALIVALTAVSCDNKNTEDNGDKLVVDGKTLEIALKAYYQYTDGTGVRYQFMVMSPGCHVTMNISEYWLGKTISLDTRSEKSWDVYCAGSEEIPLFMGADNTSVGMRKGSTLKVERVGDNFKLTLQANDGSHTIYCTAKGFEFQPN